MVFLILFLALLLAAVLVQMLREILRRKELAAALAQAKEERTDIDRFLNGMFAEMRQSGGINGAMQLAARYLAEQTGAKAAAIYIFRQQKLTCIGVWGPYPLYGSRNRLLLDNPAHLYEQLRKDSFELDQGFIGSIAAGNGPERIADPAADERFNVFLTENLNGGVMATPLRNQENLVGAACVFGSTKTENGQFTDEQLDHFQQLNAQMIMALELAKAYTEISERDRIDQELNFAQKLQRSLMPESFPAWDQFAITAFSRPAKEVNGDFYDCVQIDEDRLLVVLGDACGKGVPACMLGAMTRSMIRGMADNFQSLGDFLSELNRKMYRSTNGDRFITLGCCLLDRKNSLLEFGRAGHTDLIAFVRDHIRLIAPQGAALGILPMDFAEFDTFCTAFEPGMSLLLFSDGMTEAVNADGAEFGIERLQELFRLSCRNGETAKNAIQLMLEEVSSYEAAQEDDQTMVIIQHM